MVDWENPTNADTSETRFCHLFQNCEGLVTAPELPATTLASNCYRFMFKGCTGLTTAPDLLTESLGVYCCYKMFEGCTKLASVTMLATNVTASEALTNWLNDTADNGTLYVTNAEMTTNTTIIESLPVRGGEDSTNWTVEVAPTGEQTN